MRDPVASVVVGSELSAASPGRTACLILDLGPASAEAVAVARDLSRDVPTQVDAQSPGTEFS